MPLSNENRATTHVWRSTEDSSDVVGVNRRHLETKEAVESDLEATRSAIEDENRITGREFYNFLGKN